MTEFDIDYILEQLSIHEKTSLLAGIDFWHTKAIERLDIPSLRFSDGPNGVRGTKFFNSVPGAVLPNGTGLASTFNKKLLKKAGNLLGEEAKHKGAHVVLGPTTNIQRGPNGGRGFESFSEDPYLAGIASAEIISGIQDQKVAATIKHYVCNDLEHERNSSDSILTQRALREIYLEPFRLAVKYSSPICFMTGYNKVNGEHVSQSKFLLDGVLRKEWKWDGTIMSDWFGTYTISKAIENGLDIEMPGPPIYRTIEAVRRQFIAKELNINDIDERVLNVLKLIKYAKESGIPENAAEDSKNNTIETRNLLRQITNESIVLLKNDNSLLPFKKTDDIAVIGPNSKFGAYSGGGSASLKPYYIVTPYEGISSAIGKEAEYTVGCYNHLSLPGLGEHLLNPFTGDKGFRMSFYHEPRGTANREKFDELDLQTSYHMLVDYVNDKIKNNLFYCDLEGILIPTETADYEFGVTVLGTAQLFIDDALVVDNKTKQTKGKSFFNSGTIEVKNKIHLVKDKKYNIRIEFGSGKTYTITKEEGVGFGGNGAIAFGFAKVIDPGEEILNAVNLAKSHDKVILCIGTNGEWESEGYDRENIELPGHTNELVEAVLKANPNTVVVNQSGTPVEFPWVARSRGLIQAWFGGNELGNAISDVIFGEVNPSGKLSLSFPKKFEDNPAYLNFHTERGRVLYGEDIFVGYRYYEKMKRPVEFPFGFGLSYTEFELKNLRVEVDELTDELLVQVEIKNIGEVTGSEVIQVYVSKVESDVIRPVKELKGFNKVELSPNETKNAEIKLSLKDSISFFDEYHEKWCAQKGEYEIRVGSSSADIKLIEKFSIKNTKFWLGI